MARTAQSRPLIELELKVLEICDEHRGSDDAPGVSLPDLQAIVGPTPVAETIGLLVQDGLLEHPVAENGHPREAFHVLSAAGERILEKYRTGRLQARKDPTEPPKVPKDAPHMVPAAGASKSAPPPAKAASRKRRPAAS